MSLIKTYLHKQMMNKEQLAQFKFNYCEKILDDDDWTEQDQLETEEMLPTRYIGSVWEADDEEDLIEEISCASGWLIKEIDYRHILK